MIFSPVYYKLSNEIFIKEQVVLKFSNYLQSLISELLTEKRKNNPTAHVHVLDCKNRSGKTI